MMASTVENADINELSTRCPKQVAFFPEIKD
jgi:hypothetical protein